jgi:tight adherence protein B
VAVAVTIDGTELTAKDTLEFPKAGAATPVLGPPPALVTVVGPAPAWWESSWLLGAGAVALFVAIAVVLMGLSLRERPERRLAQEYGISAEDSGAVQWLSGASGGLTSGVQRMLERSGQARTIDAALEQAGVSIRAGEAVAAALIVSIATAMVGWYLGGWLLGVIAAATPLLIGVLVVRYRISRRRGQFAEQLGDTLLMLATSLRAGYGLVQAIDAVAREASAPTSEELSRVVVETRLDRDPSLALADVAARMQSKDFDWVVQAISIHRQSGGDLAELLDHVGETIRGRVRVERQVKALSAEGKMSGIVLVILPFVMALLITTANPDYLRPLWAQGAGRVMLAGALALLLAGGLWIRRIVEPHY